MQFSIVIPVYKVERYLRECVDSVLAQTLKDIEVILVDDGSPDNCPSICDDYARKDNRVKVIHKINGGLSDARNTGLKAASGNYVVFLDSDDYYHSESFLENVAEATEENKNDAVFFQRTTFYDNTDKPIKKIPLYNLSWNYLDVDDLLLQLSKNDMLDASACMKATKRSVLMDNNLYFRKGMYSEDVEWFNRYILFVKSVKIINQQDYYYRKRENSITSSTTEINVRDLFYSVETHSNIIRDSRISESRKKAILSYLSYEYYIVLGLINNLVKGVSRNELLNDCKQYKWLTHYSISKKTQKCAMLVRLLGLNMSGKILGRYIKSR